MEFTGILKEKSPLKSGDKNGKTWQSQDFILETVEEYPQSGIFNCFGGAKTEQISQCNTGEVLTVNFSLRGKSTEKGFFNSLSVWKIERKNASKPQAQPEFKNEIPSERMEYQIYPNKEETDGLPF